MAKEAGKKKLSSAVRRSFFSNTRVNNFVDGHPAELAVSGHGTPPLTPGSRIGGFPRCHQCDFLRTHPVFLLSPSRCSVCGSKIA